MELSINATVSLNNLAQMPLLGIGLFKIPETDIAIDSVKSALEIGYRLIDTATVYGNESAVGIAIKDSGIKRADIFLTTKLWNEDHGYKAARKALEASLKRLDTHYLDLYLIHWPVPGIRLESWRALEDMMEEGLCRSIGVSNYMKRHLVELLMNCRIKPAVNQIELSPFNFLHREDVIQFCRKNEIHIEAYSPLTKGLKLNDPRLIRMAHRYYKTPAQLLLRWAMQEGFTVIPKSVKKERLLENARIFDFNLSPEDMSFLNSMNESLVTGWDSIDLP